MTAHIIPAWARRPQVPRAYVGPVSPAKSQLPVWVRPVDKSEFFVVETEGALLTYIHEDDWELVIPFVPIYGQIRDGFTVIWDRIIAESYPFAGGLRISAYAAEERAPAATPAKKTEIPINNFLIEHLDAFIEMPLENDVVRRVVVTYLENLWGPDKLALARELLNRIT